MIKFAYVQRSM